MKKLTLILLLFSFIYCGESYDIYYEKPKDDYQAYEDTSFVSGDSPATMDIRTDLVRLVYNGEVSNDGPGDILVKFSSDGDVHSTDIRIKSAEMLVFTTHRVWKIVITHTGTDASYRVRSW